MTNKQYRQDRNFDEYGFAESILAGIGIILVLAGVFTILYLATEYGIKGPQEIIDALRR